tara:strand:- start:407 stop:1294 length:888 start_codon:yes stop_codon:yes gene_type:complete
MNKKKVLGRGLSALLKDSNQLNEGGSENSKGITRIDEIKLSSIEVNPFQPRVDFDQEKLNDLSASIKAHGVIQPITVRELGDNKYQLISGERRLRASKMADKNSIPAYIKSVNDQESLEIALIENIQREDLNSIEIATNYQRLIDDCDLTQDALSMRVGKKRSTVSNYLRLLKLPAEIQMALKDQTITMGHARAMVSVEDPLLQLKLYRNILSDQLSVRQLEKLVKNADLISVEKRTKTTKPILSSGQQLIQDKLSAYFKTRVQVLPKKRGKGELSIKYFSEQELKRILSLIYND